ncbi:hypothetical protein PTKIN_Ptkin02bG0078000 [Pterospermum kingtungense]
MSAAAKLTRIDSVLQAELYAIFHGMERALEVTQQTLVVESDSLLAIQEVRKGQRSMCEWSHLILDILDCSVDFTSCPFVQTGRAGNKLADAVSRTSLLPQSSMVWSGSLPPDVCNMDSIGHL